MVGRYLFVKCLSPQSERCLVLNSSNADILQLFFWIVNFEFISSLVKILDLIFEVKPSTNIKHLNELEVKLNSNSIDDSRVGDKIVIVTLC